MKSKINIILKTGIPALFIVLAPSIALAETQVGITASGTVNSVLVNMFPSWISLAGAIIILILAIKHMSGGALSKPFILIGIGVLADALMQIYSSTVIAGVMPITQLFINTAWVTGLFFRLSVVIGLIWIAGVFGILRQK